MARYIALLRGINVGGNTMIKMTELKAVFAKCGFENIVTYINSGNVAFDGEDVELNLVARIEQAIEANLGKQIPVMVREQRHIQTILDNNPFAGQFESHKEMHVLFLKKGMPLDKQQHLLANQTEGESFAALGREIYCHLRLGVANSLLGKGFIEKKLKLEATGRNWRTVQRLSAI